MSPNVPLIGPDSPSYLEFQSVRSSGYPFFLAVLKPIIFQTSDYAIVQYVLYGVSVLVFWQLFRTDRHPLFCLVVEIGLLANWEVNRFHFTILSESLFRFWHRCWRIFERVDHLAGGCVCIRCPDFHDPPDRGVFIAALPLLALAGTRSTPLLRRLLAIVLPLAAIVTAESLYYRAYHPGPRESLLPAQIVGKAGMVNVAHPDQLIAAAAPYSKPLQQALEFQLAPVRQLIANAPDLPARCRMAIWYEIVVEYEFALAERDEVRAAAGTGGLVRAGLDRVEMALPDYLWLTGDHLFCMWTFWATSAKESAALAAYIDAHRPLPFEDDVLSHLEQSRLPPFAATFRLAMLSVAVLLALVSILFLLSLCSGRRMRQDLWISGVCALTVHAGMILSALGSVGIPRYTIGFWPPMEVGLLFFVAWITRSVRESGRLKAPASKISNDVAPS